LDQGTVVTSKTEKLIEGDTKYEYLSIFPELLIDVDEALHTPGKCDTIQCKLLKDCDETDEIVSTDAQIVDTASGLAKDFRIQMDTDPLDEFYLGMCVSCSNRNTTVNSEVFFLHTYYPCEDELIKSSMA
jgi:hypothetical protein